MAMSLTSLHAALAATVLARVRRASARARLGPASVPRMAAGVWRRRWALPVVQPLDMARRWDADQGRSLKRPPWMGTQDAEVAAVQRQERPRGVPLDEQDERRVRDADRLVPVLRRHLDPACEVRRSDVREDGRVTAEGGPRRATSGL
jgi:hypothetical protein